MTISKVYRANLVGDENLIYDFSANVGDTVFLGNNFIIVEAVDTVLFANTERRYCLFNNGEEWYTGIGSLEGLLESGTADLIGGDNELLCYSEDGASLYMNPDYTDCYVNINYMDKIQVSDALNSFIIYPNPASSTLTIGTTEQLESYEIYNQIGQEVMSGTLQNKGSTLIDISTLPSGLFFIIANCDMAVFSGRFVKE